MYCFEELLIMLNFAPQLLRSLIMINYYHHSEPFSLELGGRLDALRIAYHTYGTLNADKSNVIWVCHALTGNSDVQDWWPHTVEAVSYTHLTLPTN